MEIMEIAWLVALALVVSGPLIGFFSAHAWAEAQGLQPRTDMTRRTRHIPVGEKSRA